MPTPRLARVLLALAFLAGGFVALVLWALESKEVVVLRTADGAGGRRETRVWIAEDAGGASWIEAASPERPWLRDVEARPDVELVRGGRTQRCRAAPVPGPEAHLHVRRLLRAKYGLRDVVVGLLADTSRSVGVRVECPR